MTEGFSRLLFFSGNSFLLLSWRLVARDFPGPGQDIAFLFFLVSLLSQVQCQ